MKKATFFKKDSSSQEMGMLSVSDKIIQRAVKMVNEPFFEKLFLDVSYDYRPNKCPAKDVKRLLHNIHFKNLPWVVVCDINNCFDAIPHKPFLVFLGAFLNDKAFLGLKGEWIKMRRVSSDFKWIDSSIGLFSRRFSVHLLNNFYLYPVNEAMLKKMKIIRNADDFIIVGKIKEEYYRKFWYSYL